MGWDASKPADITTFNTVPVSGQRIYLNYIIFRAGRPESILYYDNKFQLFPVPEPNEWGPAIAYGAAREIALESGDTTLYSECEVDYRKEIAYILMRTLQNLLNIRAEYSECEVYRKEIDYILTRTLQNLLNLRTEPNF